MARSEQMDTSRKLLQRAQILLQTKGFNALSFQELADAIGIRKASVYHHFSTKQDLAVAAIRDYAQRFEEWARGVEGKSPTERLESYFEMLWSVTAKGKSVCPGGALSLDWKGLSEEAREELRRLLWLHRSFLKSLFEDGRATKVFAGVGANVDALVSLVGASMQGGLQMARVSPDPQEYFQRLQGEIRRILGVRA